MKPKNDILMTKMDGVTDANGVLNIFNDKYKNIFNDHRCQDKPANYDENIKRIKTSVSHSYFKITQTEVEKAIRSLKCCLGLDGLHSNHYKFGGKTLISFISDLFTSMLAHGFVPWEMLRGELRPIIKDNHGKLDCSNNYRPITISGNSLKIFEYCIADHLQTRLILNRRQFGFRKNTSTYAAVTVLKEVIHQYNSKGSKVFTSFLDLSKAFDKVNHFMLINKLCNSTVSPIIVNILKNMYEKQFVHVNFKGADGEEWLLGNGVRQGGVISPLLFNYYINDILNEIADLSVGCKLNMIRHNIQGYADDLTLLAPSASGLQLLVDRLSAMLSDLCLTLNTDKSVFMIFTQKNIRNENLIPKLKLNGINLIIVNSYKYLGVIVTSNSSNGEDIKRAESSFLRQFYLIFRKFHSVDQNVLSYLFQSHCMSFYGCELWHDLSGSISYFKSLSINYHKSIKKIMSRPWMYSNHDVCIEAGVPVFRHFLNLRLLSFGYSLLNSKSACLLPYLPYLKTDAICILAIKKIFKNVYQIPDLFTNDIDAVRARIFYVQNREERSNFYLENYVNV
jgi:hypothetical protein